MRVRGTCKAGHVTEALSDPGRVTWEGTCSTDGCELPVKARRAPRSRPEVTAPATPAPDDAGDPKLRKVNYAAQQPKPRGTDKPADAPAGGDAGGAQSQPAAAAPAAVQDAGGRDASPAAAAVESGTGPTRRGLRDRLRERQQRPRPSAAFKLPWEND